MVDYCPRVFSLRLCLKFLRIEREYRVIKVGDDTCELRRKRQQ